MERILIIEDSMIAQSRLSDILAKEYELEFQSDGRSGITAAHANPPGMILLDVHLPGMNGHDVCRALKNETSTMDVPVIFITSMDSERERVKGFEAGGDDYIVKPFFPGELLARVRAHLSSRRAKEQAVELERLKLFREMAVAVSHEINNPLTAIFASLYVLERGASRGDVNLGESISEIRRELERIKAVTGKLAAASKVVKTGYVRETEMIDINGLMEQPTEDPAV